MYVSLCGARRPVYVCMCTELLPLIPLPHSAATVRTQHRFDDDTRVQPATVTLLIARPRRVPAKCLIEF
jgi:hypothetical protein